jgi:DNA replication and repair protein RecF
MAQQAGIQHTGSDWQARMNGVDVDNLGRFCEQFPVLSFDPGSHELIIGASEVRRRFVDWALFHVEPEFHPVWRRFNRALKQRNALLKTQPGTQELASWDQEFAEAGDSLHHLRKLYLKTLEPVMQRILSRFLPECGGLSLSYSAGWREQQMSLLDALRLNRDRDIQSGFCGVGPHRADWQPSLDDRLHRDHFSRGQAKLLALAALLAQTEDFVAKKGFWPILCFDDLASELDQAHFSQVLTWLAESQAQIWISGTESLPVYQGRFPHAKLFHVEHGQIQTPAGE